MREMILPAFRERLVVQGGEIERHYFAGVGLVPGALASQTVRKRKRGFGVSPAISIYQSAPAS
jgi:hypothetical protein